MGEVMSYPHLVGYVVAPPGQAATTSCGAYMYSYIKLTSYEIQTKFMNY